MPAVTENFRIQASGYLSLAIPFVERLIFQDVTSLRLVHRTQALFTERLDAVFRNRTFHFLQEFRITLCDSEFPSERYVIKLNPNRACQMFLVTGIGSANQGKIEIQNFTAGTTPGYVDAAFKMSRHSREPDCILRSRLLRRTRCRVRKNSERDRWPR